MPHALRPPIVWPEAADPKPFVSLDPLATVEIGHWFIGCILYPVAVRLLQAGFLHATKTRAEEKGLDPTRHFRAAVFFVTAVGYVDVLLLIWPMTVHIMHCFFMPHDMLELLVTLDWRLFRWALAVLCGMLVVELVQSQLKLARTLHHVSLLLSFCLMSGIPWISHYDLPLFATAPLLYMSFQSFNCLEYFALSYFYMQTRPGQGARLLHCMSVYTSIVSIMGHLSMICFYFEFVRFFQAWAPVLVLFMLQLCLAAENVHDILRLRRLARSHELPGLPGKPSAPHLPTVLGGAAIDAVKKVSTV